MKLMKISLWLIGSDFLLLTDNVEDFCLFMTEIRAFQNLFGL